MRPDATRLRELLSGQVDRRTAWVTGASLTDDGDAEVYRTTDAGRSWQEVGPPRTAGLNFRDVEATDARTASVLAIGEGAASRAYRTTDGGRTWERFSRARFHTLDCTDDGACWAAGGDGRVGRLVTRR